MEFLAALLTIVSFWVFLYAWTGPALAVVQRESGPPLLEVRLRHVRWRQTAALGLGAVAAVLLAWFFVAFLDQTNKMFGLQQAYNVLLIGMAVVAGVRRASRPGPFFQNGISLGWRSVRPWSQVRYCKWMGDSGRLFVQFNRQVSYYRFRPQQIAAVTDALSKYVEIRDSTGAVIASPATRPAEPANAEPVRRRLQFGLRTLLIFTVFASSAASWAGIRAERTRREEAAVAPLAQNYPIVRRRGTSIIGLDFSLSQVKPGDEELVHLANLDHLEWVDLSGSPVTDTGIEHLARLRTLKLVNLSGTAVTPAGVKELERALPGTSVIAPLILPALTGPQKRGK